MALGLKEITSAKKYLDQAEKGTLKVKISSPDSILERDATLKLGKDKDGNYSVSIQSSGGIIKVSLYE